MEQATELALQLAGAHISHGTARLAYCMMVCPKLEYPLAVTQFTPGQCNRILSKKIRVMLPKLGFNRNLPRAVVFGPFGRWPWKALDYTICTWNKEYDRYRHSSVICAKQARQVG